MAETTAISWCDSTFNPWTGCTKVSPGCDHCYAESWSKRSGMVQWGPGNERRRTSVSNWRKPLQWNGSSRQFFAEHGRNRRVFCASLADVFDNEVPAEWRLDLFKLIFETPHLDWLLLTKRIGNVEAMLDDAQVDTMRSRYSPLGWPWTNVWLGISAVNQAEADRDIPKLLATPAALRFLSLEPLLGFVDVSRWLAPWNHTESRYGRRIDWVIVGGESGPHARPMEERWAISLRDQCSYPGVQFLLKQNGGSGPAKGGNLLAGREHMEWPLPLFQTCS